MIAVVLLWHTGSVNPVIYPINRSNPATCVCLSQARRLEVYVRFDDVLELLTIKC